MNETAEQREKRAAEAGGDRWVRRAYAMREMVDLIDLDRGGLSAPEDAAVAALCERHGYGAVMDAAARLWARKDPIGAFTVGPCRALIEGARAAWREE